MKPSPLDLGYTDAAYNYPPIETESGKKESEKAPVIYPSLSIEQKPQLLEALEVGQEIIATVKLKVVGLTDKQGGRRYDPGDRCTVEFDVLSIDPKGISLATDQEESAEDAMQKHFAEKDAE